MIKLANNIGWDKNWKNAYIYERGYNCKYIYDYINDIIFNLYQYHMRYLVNMVYKCKGKSYLTYEVDAESREEAIEQAKIGNIDTVYEDLDDIQLVGEPESIDVEEDE